MPRLTRSAIIDTVPAETLDWLLDPSNAAGNRIVNQFVAVDDNTTRWVADNEFRFEGVRKALGLLEGSFKKETLESMELFKAFVERTPAE